MGITKSNQHTAMQTSKTQITNQTKALAEAADAAKNGTQANHSVAYNDTNGLI